MQLAVIDDRPGPDLGGDRLGLFGTRVGHRHQLDVRQRGQDPGVMLAEMADSDDSNAQRFHRSMSP